MYSQEKFRHRKLNIIFQILSFCPPMNFHLLCLKPINYMYIYPLARFLLAVVHSYLLLINFNRSFIDLLYVKIHLEEIF